MIEQELKNTLEEEFFSLLYFIETKSRQISSEIQVKSRLINRNRSLQKTSQKMSIKEVAMAYADRALLEIELDALNSIFETLNCFTENNNMEGALQILIIYLLRDINNTCEFNTYHPLYGFVPFHKMLLEHYQEIEDYEKCMFIKAIVNRKEIEKNLQY